MIRYLLIGSAFFLIGLSVGEYRGLMRVEAMQVEEEAFLGILNQKLANIIEAFGRLDCTGAKR